MRRRWLVALVALLLLAAGVATAGIVVWKQRHPGSIRGSGSTEFVTTEAPGATTRPVEVVREIPWPTFGYDNARTRFAPDFRLRPPFRVVWNVRGGSLLEFPPAIAYENKPLTVFGDGSQHALVLLRHPTCGLVLLAESGEHLPVNLGNPHEMTLLEFAETVLRVTSSRSEIVFEALPVHDPQVRQPDITRAEQILGWQPELTLEEALSRTVGSLTAGERAGETTPL